MSEVTLIMNTTPYIMNLYTVSVQKSFEIVLNFFFPFVNVPFTSNRAVWLNRLVYLASRDPHDTEYRYFVLIFLLFCNIPHTIYSLFHSLYKESSLSFLVSVTICSPHTQHLTSILQHVFQGICMSDSCAFAGVFYNISSFVDHCCSGPCRRRQCSKPLRTSTTLPAPALPSRRGTSRTSALRVSLRCA